MSPPASQRSWWRGFAAVLSIAAAAFVLYGPALAGGFVWDDFGYIDVFRKFETVGFFESLQWFWAPREWFPMRTYRPVLELSYAYEWHLWGFWAEGYRWTNLLAHVGCAVLVAVLVRRFAAGRVPDGAAVLAGLAFALSPAHPESVMWLSSRVNLFALLFMLAALWVFSCRRHLLTALFAFLAMGSKETAYVLPALLSVIAWWSPELPGPLTSWRGRLLAVLRRTWPSWLLLGGYFLLRHHALGTWTGGYQWRPPPDYLSLGYLRERLDLMFVTFAPVNLERNPGALRHVLLGCHAVALAALLFVAWRRQLGRAALVALSWFVLANLPIFNAPFTGETVRVLSGARLLYEPTAAVVFGCGLALGGLPALRWVALPGLCLVYGLVAWANAEPWVVTERLGAEITAFTQRVDESQDEDPPPRIIVDLPSEYDGAFLYMESKPRLLADFYPAAAVRSVELLRQADGGERVLRRIDAVLDQVGSAAANLEVWRADLPSRREPRLVAESLDPRYPLELGEQITLRYARAVRFDLRAGGSLRVDLLVDARRGAGWKPWTLHLLSADGRLEDTFTRGSVEADGRSARRLTLPLRRDLRPGSYRLELEVGGRRASLFDVTIAGPRTWL